MEATQFFDGTRPLVAVLGLGEGGGAITADLD
jgi:hypothetical protein